MEFNKKKFIEFFIKNGGISFFDKSSKGKYSGKPSTIYFNWRTISEDVYNLEKCAEHVISYLQNKKIKADCFVGVPEGATKLAIILQYKWAKKSTKFKKGSHNMSFVRGKSKEHGVPKDRDFLGIPKGKIILIEDIVYRGGGVIDTLKKLRKVKVVPHCIIALSDRTNKEYKNKLIKYLSKRKIKYYPITTEKEVLQEAIKILKPSTKIVAKLKERINL